MTTETKLEQVWREVNRTTVEEFFKRAIRPETTLAELLSVLSFERIEGIKQQLGEIPLGSILESRPTKLVEFRRAKTIMRTRRETLEKELLMTMQALKENPNSSRGELLARLTGHLGNKNPMHVSYLLRKLVAADMIEQQGQKKAARYSLKSA